jgi:DNA gyrase subunit A
MGRATQGVRLINLKGSDTIAAVAKVERSEEDEVEDAVVLDEDGNPIVTETSEETTSNDDNESSEEADNGKDVDNNDED